MLKSWTNTGRRVAALLCVFGLLFPGVLLADNKKKATPSAQEKPGDKRIKGYVDISKLVWPSPPELARIRFVDQLIGEKIDPTLYQKKPVKQNWKDRLAGTETHDEIKVDTLPFQLIRTYGVGSDSKGRIYAADQAVGAVFIFDQENKDKVELIGNGRQANFGLITGLALDDDDRLFVADAKLHRITVFSPKHQELVEMGTGDLVRPGGIAIDHENRLLYVADSGNDSIAVFDADTYKFLRHIGVPSRKHDATEPGLMSLPEAVAVDADGNVYVTDTFNNRIEVFDGEGNFIRTWGKNSDAPKDFQRPKGIAIDGDGHVWVVDAMQNRVKVYSREGRLLIYFGQEGYLPGQFMGPWGIFVDKFNRLIISETYPGRVQVFRYVTDAEAATLKAEQAKAAASEQKQPEKQTEQPAAAPATPPATVPPTAGKSSTAS
jgi:DNA-binding beta-propeller fold protein YncE